MNLLNKQKTPFAAPVNRLVGRIRELMAKGTQGKWFIGNACDDRVCAVIQSATCANICMFDAQYHGRYDADQDLIVEAINALPVLLDIAEAAWIKYADQKPIIGERYLIYIDVDTQFFGYHIISHNNFYWLHECDKVEHYVKCGNSHLFMRVSLPNPCDQGAGLPGSAESRCSAADIVESINKDKP